jgi:membrane-bound lytic murein transglycosylase A
VRTEAVKRRRGEQEITRVAFPDFSFSLFLLFPVFLLFPCSCNRTGTTPPVLERLDSASLPTFADDLDRPSLKAAIQQSLIALRGKKETEGLAFGEERVSVGRIRDGLTAFLALLETGTDLQLALQRDFEVYHVAIPVLFTGYYEPLLHGNLVPTERYRYPLYRRPDDLVEVDLSVFSPEHAGEKLYGRVVNGKLLPYFSREEIDGRDVLAGKGYELVWVDDPIARFFLHIQGSGQIQLPDGQRLRVGYAGTNGKAYRSIGKWLLDQGKLRSGETSTPAIRRYLREHEEEQDTIFFHNQRYIFFHITPLTAEGPQGSLGVPLTPGRSLATDPKIYPPGALGFIHTRRPVVDTQGEITWKEFSRFVLLQDRGAAITGWKRADLFWGSGDDTEAGSMAQEGTFYLVLKKP